MEHGEVLSCLWDLFTECCQGQERVAVLTGVTGTGETELGHTFAERAIAKGAIYCGAVASRVERTLQLGVMDQLFISTELPAQTRERAARLLADGAIAALANSLEPEAPNEVPPHIVHSLGMLLLDLAESTDRPLLIAVDDAQHADLPSLHCLSSVIGRLRRARVMVLISASSGPQPFNPMFLADLPPEPYCRHIRLEVLSESGVEAMLAERLGGRTAELLTTECYRISGGNPALVRGLIDDYCLAVKGQETQPLTVGPGASQALLSILHRCEFSMLSLARGLAVLDEPVAASVAGRLVGLDRESTARAVTALNRTGSLDRGRFRHPKLRTAVLDGLAPAEQAAMHARAAEILRIDGAPASTVARHLLAAEGAAADGAEGAWVAPVLSDAAEQALSDGEVNRALGYLRLAYRVSASEPQRAVTQAMLTRAEWRVNPALAMRHSADLITAIHSGDLTGHHALTSVSLLMWFGRADDAREALRHIGDSSETLDQASRAQLAALRVWLSNVFPVTGEHAPVAVLSDEPQPTSVMVNPMWQAVQLVAALTRGADESPIAAEHILEASSLEERTFTLLTSVLATLLYSERVGVADMWCDSLQKDAAAQGAPTWHAVFTALRSVIAFRQGNLVAAEIHARTAMVIIPAKSWGIGVGIPLSILVQVATAMGKYQEALGHLYTPVPDALFETPLGLHYLQARGRFHYAREDFHAALRDFQSIADLTAQWGMDMPALVPWRTDTALTFLRLGRSQLAHELVTEQLKKLAPRQVRERGVSLKVLAACSELPKRAGLLSQAVEELQSCGDRLELAYALADLGQAYQALGRLGQARAVRRRAYRIAKQCGAAMLGDSLLPDADGAPQGGEDAVNNPVSMDLYAGLSMAERRVAALAGDGYSNRQIASKLFITVSTVEQHLTRVYSKLKVKHRTDLPQGATQRSSGRLLAG